MRLACLCLLIVVAAAPAGGDGPAKKDVDALQGTWDVVALEYNGKNLAEKYKLAFVFQGPAATVEGNDAVRKEYAKVSFKLDPGTTPKCVDLTVGGGGQLGVTMEGIYALKGDELRLCVKVFGNDRPGEFASPAGSSIALLTLRRQK